MAKRVVKSLKKTKKNNMKGGNTPESMRERGKANHFKPGHKGGGRKPLAIELKAREAILHCIGGSKGFEELVAKIFQKAKAGSFRHQELLLNYILGKPTDKLKIENASGADLNAGAPIVKIIADTIRLDRLNKDIAERDKTTPEERIKEAEEILNKEIDNQT